MTGRFFARPRIVLADDHKANLTAVELFLETDYDVVGTVGDGLSLAEAIERLKPDGGR